MDIDWRSIVEDTDWGIIGPSLITALGGGAVGAWLQGRRQDRTERNQRRERAAEVLAEARAFLADAHPDRLAFNANQDTFDQTFRDLRERLDRVRIPLLTLAAGHPSRRVRDLGRQLEVAMYNTLNLTGWFVGDLLRGRGDTVQARADARRLHDDAVRLLDQLQEAIQRG